MCKLRARMGGWGITPSAHVWPATRATKILHVGRSSLHLRRIETANNCKFVRNRHLCEIDNCKLCSLKMLRVGVVIRPSEIKQRIIRLQQSAGGHQLASGARAGG
jgi:hypothetical protein